MTHYLYNEGREQDFLASLRAKSRKEVTILRDRRGGETKNFSLLDLRRELEAGVRFADDLPVLEDWDFLMQIAPLTGVTSINAQTSRQRIERGRRSVSQAAEASSPVNATTVTLRCVRRSRSPARVWRRRTFIRRSVRSVRSSLT